MSKPVDTSNERLLWAKEQFAWENKACTLGDPVWKYQLLQALIDEVIEHRRIRTEREAEDKKWVDASMEVIKTQLAARGEKWEDQ